MQNIRTGKDIPDHLVCTLMGWTDRKRGPGKGSDLYRVTHQAGAGLGLTRSVTQALALLGS